MTLWSYAPGDNHAVAITISAARRVAWDGSSGTAVVDAPTEGEAYRRITDWNALGSHDDVGALGLDWTQVEGCAVLIEY